MKAKTDMIIWKTEHILHKDITFWKTKQKYPKELLLWAEIEQTQIAKTPDW
jgi:hypothetical protein